MTNSNSSDPPYSSIGTPVPFLTSPNGPNFPDNTNSNMSGHVVYGNYQMQPQVRISPQMFYQGGPGATFVTPTNISENGAVSFTHGEHLPSHYMPVGHQQTQTSFPSVASHQVPFEHRQQYLPPESSSQIPTMISSVHSSEYTLDVGQYVYHPYALHPSVTARLPVSPEEAQLGDDYSISATTIRSFPNVLPAGFHQDGRQSPLYTSPVASVHGSNHSVRHSHASHAVSVAGDRTGFHNSLVSPVVSVAASNNASHHSNTPSVHHVPVHSGSIHGSVNIIPVGSSSPMPQYLPYIVKEKKEVKFVLCKFDPLVMSYTEFTTKLSLACMKSDIAYLLQEKATTDTNKKDSKTLAILKKI